MSKLMKKLAPTAFIVASLFPVHLLAAEAKDNVVDMNSYLCKDMMRMSGEDRAIGLAVLHGYVLGKKGAVSYDTTALSMVTDEFIDYCLDHPNDKALASFEKIAK